MLFSGGYMNSSYDKTTITLNDYQAKQQDLMYKRLKLQKLQDHKQLTKNHLTFQQQSSIRHQPQGGILRKKIFRKNDTITAADLPENVNIFY